MSQMEIDFNLALIRAKQDSTRHKIPDYFQRGDFKVGDLAVCRISNVYDPSKFWLVPKSEELEMFQKFLASLYQKQYKQLVIPLGEIRVHLYCVIHVQGTFYRGEIVQIPLPSVNQKEWKVVVFLIDYGAVEHVLFENILYMHQKLLTIPKLSVRACLAHTYPIGSSWTTPAVTRFCQLAAEKVMLAKIEHMDELEQIWSVFLKEANDFTKKPVRTIMIEEGIASNVPRYIRDPTTAIDASGIRCWHLLPTFREIEHALVPTSVAATETLLQTVPRHILFRQYYKF